MLQVGARIAPPAFVRLQPAPGSMGMVLATPAAIPSAHADDVDVGLLVTAAAGGDASAFQRLYETYAQRVYNMILRSVRDPGAAEDVAQDVWTKVHREMRTLREPRCFPAWLFRIAAKKCVDSARRRKRRPEAAPLSDDLGACFGDPEQSVIAREDAARMWEALAGLTPKQHMALYLREVEQRSYREIAYVLRISETAVGLCIFRARRGLASAYEQLSEAPHSACVSTHRVMSLSLDGHATPIQQRALTAHIDRCQPCRADFSAVQSAARGYAGLALAPAPLVLHEHLLGAAPSLNGALGIGKLLAWLAPNAKAAAIGCTLAVTAGATTVAAAPQLVDVMRPDAQQPAIITDRSSADGVSANAADGDDEHVSSDDDLIASEPGFKLGHEPDLALPVSPPPGVVLPGAPVTLVDGTVDRTLDSTLTLVDTTLEQTLTTVDATLDEALTTVDETLHAVEGTLEDVDTTLDKTIEDVDQALDDVLAPVLGPPTPAASPQPDPEPTPDVLEPVIELLPSLP
jgi:RNA polymerase sigma-70 factor (ECF subfamily)